jgi:hypothetical protein
VQPFAAIAQSPFEQGDLVGSADQRRDRSILEIDGSLLTVPSSGSTATLASSSCTHAANRPDHGTGPTV